MNVSYTLKSFADFYILLAFLLRFKASKMVLKAKDGGGMG